MRKSPTSSLHRNRSSHCDDDLEMELLRHRLLQLEGRRPRQQQRQQQQQQQQRTISRSKSPGTQSEDSLQNHLSGDDFDDDDGSNDNDNKNGLMLTSIRSSRYRRRSLEHSGSTDGTLDRSSCHSMGSNAGVFGDDDDDDDDDSTKEFQYTSREQFTSAFLNPTSDLSTNPDKSYQTSIKSTTKESTSISKINQTRKEFFRKPPTKSTSMEPHYSGSEFQSEKLEKERILATCTVPTAKSIIPRPPTKSTSMVPQYSGSDNDDENDNGIEQITVKKKITDPDISPYKATNTDFAVDTIEVKVGAHDQGAEYKGEMPDLGIIPLNTEFVQTPPIGMQVFSASSKRPSTRKKSPYDSVVTAAVGAQGMAKLNESTKHLDHLVNDLEDLAVPAFRQFALLCLPHEVLLKRLHDDRMLRDDGPRNLDAFLLQDVNIVDSFPNDDRIGNDALSAFCLPDGLRVRFLPKACMEGAVRMGMVGPNGDRCHILVFTNGAGKADHGVAITIKSEIVLAKGERMRLNLHVLERQQKRLAATKIARWFKSKIKTRILTEALQLSGFEGMYVEELKAELTAGEVKTLAKILRQNSPREESKSRGSSDSEKSVPFSTTRGDFHKQQGTQKKLRAIMSRKVKKEHQNVLNLSQRFPPKRSQAEKSEVATVTRNAMLRSASTALIQPISNNVSHSENYDSLDDQGATVARGLRRFLSNDRSTKSGITGPSTRGRIAASLITTTTTIETPPSQWAKDKAIESYNIMKANEKQSLVCIVEKCYSLIGCQPGEYALLLGPLQELVNCERSEIINLRNSLAETEISASKTNRAEQVRKLEKEQSSRRNAIILTMLQRLRLTTQEALVSFPTSELVHVSKPNQFFTCNIPHLTYSQDIKLPLPLPQVGNQWGLAVLLLDIGPDSLILTLKLMLLERSILVLGVDWQKVTACACALLELLKPFEWATVFMPVLPHKMLDFVNSPVPFVAGIAVTDAARVMAVESDERTLDAMAHGMSVLNLSTNTLHITSEQEIAGMISIDPYLREQLHFLRTRVQLYCSDNPDSGLRNFQTFIRYGLEPHESLSLHSVCIALEQHFSRYCRDLSTIGSAWKRYGTLDGERFIFRAEWFLNPIRADVLFQEAVVQTQLFSGYVNDRRQDELDRNDMRTGVLGKFIANWVYQRWNVQTQKRVLLTR